MGSHIIKNSLCISFETFGPYLSGPSASHILRYLQYMRSITVSFQPDVHGLWCVMPKVHMQKVHRGPWCVTWPENSSVQYYYYFWFFFTCFLMFIGTPDVWRNTYLFSSRPTMMRDLNIQSKRYSNQCDPLVCWEYNLLF